jgi:hypothetical protein
MMLFEMTNSNPLSLLDFVADLAHSIGIISKSIPESVLLHTIDNAVFVRIFQEYFCYSINLSNIVLSTNLSYDWYIRLRSIYLTMEF